MSPVAQALHSVQPAEAGTSRLVDLVTALLAAPVSEQTARLLQERNLKDWTGQQTPAR